MPDEMMQGNNAFRRQNKEMERKEFKEGRLNEVEEEEKRVIWWITDWLMHEIEGG